MSDIILECPHCKGIIIVDPKQINCAIFRHGIFKSNGTQVNPHAPKSECDHLIATNQVNGCCKPFRMVKEIKQNTPGETTTENPTEQWRAVKCDYI